MSDDIYDARPSSARSLGFSTHEIASSFKLYSAASIQGRNKQLLVVIDGWGIAGPNSPPEGDAIAAANTPNMDAFKTQASGYTEIDASSLAVGLPEGLMGNSEVGHLNIGAGRVVWQDVVRIDQTVKKGEMGDVPNVVKSFQRAIDGNGRLHLLGLVSDGGVHAHMNHLFVLLDVAKKMGVPEVYIHFFGDGRDTDPKSAAGYMQQLLDKTKSIGLGKIATVVGRYYAMDRDKRWERVTVALNGLVKGEGEASTDPVATIKARYEAGENDEFLKPIIVNGDEGRLKDNDTLFFFNYRSDRVREITQLLGDFDRSFPGEERELIPSPRVATYDLQPEMSAAAVGEKMAERIAEKKFDLVMNNFAPPDMVGHTGVYEAAIKGVETTDAAIGTVLKAAKENGYILFITADHGNAEEMKTEKGTPKTSHTCNKVPFVMLNAPEGWSLAKEDGVLGDVAPTVLAAMGVEQPEEMTGKSLLIKN
ncbi:2,3-bisphosphoglycerate-independent phosphoglycerate mutase [Ascosphaera apis ARSEF 7405]|uniref:phosphoglycerate mutase (2,3-diphosphoglycerate-independent) n=1 Tax=Ascosphaera apis ARSEF 7405 TaxID=392613 RepID=A0A167XGC9_9EURO|nr:2,3-bisphosphoglycerate-independent phosphoglycerate mutase [Ascosphaera apis ARSEF 7405]